MDRVSQRKPVRENGIDFAQLRLPPEEELPGTEIRPLFRDEHPSPLQCYPRASQDGPMQLPVPRFFLFRTLPTRQRRMPSSVPCVNLSQSGRFSGNHKWPLLSDRQDLDRWTENLSYLTEGVSKIFNLFSVSALDLLFPSTALHRAVD
jgi:hypothetical protein